MAYSTATFQAASILLFVHFKSEEGMYEFLSTKKIAEMLSIPAPTVVRVLNRLNAAGLIHTKEGAKGGILPAKPLANITMLDVFQAVEQGKPLFKIQYNFSMIATPPDETIARGVRCLEDAENAMKASLAKVTLLDLLE